MAEDNSKDLGLQRGELVEAHEVANLKYTSYLYTHRYRHPKDKKEEVQHRENVAEAALKLALFDFDQALAKAEEMKSRLEALVVTISAWEWSRHREPLRRTAEAHLKFFKRWLNDSTPKRRPRKAEALSNFSKSCETNYKVVSKWIGRVMEDPKSAFLS